MAQLGNLIVTGVSRLLSKLYVNDSVTAPTFIGKLQGNADTATSSTKLTTSAGSATQPVYFSDGKPVATTYTLGKSVPSNAVFTDTNTWRPLGTTADTACAGNDSRLSNSRPASDVSAWAKASTKPSYTWSEIGSKPTTFAPSSHNHDNSTITSVDASKIKSGTIDIARLPQGALDRLVKVADDDARFKLTTSSVQLGDTVKVTATGKMYIVVDESNLANENGYEVYTADTAASVPWSGVTGKPSSYPPLDHTHRYAGSSSVGGSANSAVRLDTIVAGNNIKPVYFSDGKPVACTYTLGRSVPSDAVFTDTKYDIFVGCKGNPALDGKSGLVPTPAASNYGQFLRSDGTWATPTNTTYGVVNTSSNGLMSSSDKTKLDGFVVAATDEVETYLGIQ